jgi:hypothetical protein
VAEEGAEAGGHLLEGQRVVEGCNGYVAAIKNARPASIRVEAGTRIETPKGSLSGGSSADSAWAETST